MSKALRYGRLLEHLFIQEVPQLEFQKASYLGSGREFEKYIKMNRLKKSVTELGGGGCTNLVT
jgi:hypothetical protein